METPKELGLPKKFSAWRDGQAEIIEEIATSGTHHFLLDAPTGTGKSIIGIGTYKKMLHAYRVLARLRGEPEGKKRCIYVTRTKNLQDQILREFPEAKTVKGRNNYPCMKHIEKWPEYTAENCHNHKTCSERRNCQYWQDKDAALSAPIAVLNDAYYLSEINGPGTFSDAEFVILDEIDSIESALMNFITFTVSSRQLKRLELKPPQNPERASSWLGWAEITVTKLKKHIIGIDQHLGEIDDELWSGAELDMQKQKSQYTSFANKLYQFTGLVDDSWIFYKEDDGENWKVTFKPVLISEYADMYLWSHSQRTLGMSGTILNADILADEIKLENYSYKAIPSPFPLKNRPIYYHPACNITQKTRHQELPKLAAEIEDIISQYPEQKILIHTTSYAIQRYLMDRLPAGRLAVHNTGDKEKVLEAFKETTHPMVLLSPSFDRGVDLAGEMCRCVIICKVPWMNLTDRQVKARLQLPGGQNWYHLRAAQTIMQMSGRAVRGPDDYCDTWILDKQFGRLRKALENTLPKWWQDAIKEV